MLQAKQILVWAKQFLKSQDISYQSDFLAVRITPWSSVYCLDTKKGRVYLKQMALPFKIEAVLIDYLAQQFPYWLPKIIGCNTKLFCFLMWEAGLPLRTYLKQHYEVQVSAIALFHYALIQQIMLRQLTSLLQLGVPDWRLANIPHLYLALLQQKNILLKDGLSLLELDRLYALYPVVGQLCNELSLCGIPETLEHGDFHDNNILLKSHHLIIHDWGDAVITHPFFSLISFLKSAERNHQLNCQNSHYQVLKQAYLEPWLVVYGPEAVLKAVQLAWRLSPIKFVLSFFRVVLCPGMDDFGDYKGTIATALRSFLKDNDKCFYV